MVEEALKHYLLRNPKAELIRHNENMTYKITCEGNIYVMRIHRPTDGFSVDIFGVRENKAEYLSGELKAIDFLRKRTGIRVQKPVFNIDGETVTFLSDGTPVTLLEWIDGETLESVSVTPEILYKVGAMTAEMHICFRNIRPEDGIRRFSYDNILLSEIKKQIDRALDTKNITAGHADTIKASLREISLRMDILDDNHESIMLIHSDLSKSNIIYSGGKLIPIDFSLSGYSYFYMDIGSLFGHFIKDEEREAIIRGYRSITGEAVEQYFIEPFLVLQVILFIVCQHEKIAKLEWFSGAMDRWYGDLFVPLTEKKPIL